jgi:carnitine 3-dehydrogenase
VRGTPRTISVVGAGAIGGSWSALALAHGNTVLAADPNSDARTALPAMVADHLRALDVAADALERLTVHADVADAAAAADLVIEAGPERIDLKRTLFATLDAAAAPDVVLASSSSGFGPSAFQDACRHPDRVVVAHPFNPPHLIPLVEIVGGRLTSEATIAATTAAMTALGRRPVRVRAELPGHVVNRAVADGPGLRWALLGPIASQHLSGGPGGLAHVLEHLGPPMAQWWADLGAPELTPELTDRLVEGVREEFDGRERELREDRDRALRELLAVKQRNGLGGR